MSSNTKSRGDKIATEETIKTLQELESDTNIPKNVKSKIHHIIDILKDDEPLRFLYLSSLIIVLCIFQGGAHIFLLHISMAVTVCNPFS